MDVIVRDATSADAPAIARVHIDSWRSTYRGIVPDEYLAGLSYRERESAWVGRLTTPTKGVCTVVAQDERGTIEGFANGGPERGDNGVHGIYAGELYAVYLADERRGKGIGRACVRAVVDRLASQGLTSLLVWVLADNPARGFYEALDGRYVCTRQIAIGGISLDECAYGWADTTALRRTATNTVDKLC